LIKWLFKPLEFKIDKKKSILDAGNWFGNDSTWRMVVDLNKIIFFADSKGRLCKSPQRKVFSIINGIIGGEKEGPLIPTREKSGVLIAGFNPIAVDLVATRLMDFDWRKIKIYANLLKNNYFNFFISTSNPNEIKLISNYYQEDIFAINSNSYLNFIPLFGWKRKIEIRK